MGKFKTILLLLQILIATALTGCHQSKKDEPQEPTSCTVLVYMVACNNLGQDVTVGGTLYERADGLDIDEMLSAATTITNGSRWLVYRSSYESTELLELTKTGFKVLKTYDEGIATSAERMTEVLDDAFTLAPAEHKGLVLWSHATGWIEDGYEDTLDNNAEISTMSFGNHRGRKMNVTTLRTVLEANPVDYIYFDCCLMGSVEVAYELRNCADYIVASPSELPREGMPYQLNIAPLTRGDINGVLAAATNTFDWYNTKTGSDRTATMAVIETRHLDALARATAAIYAITPPEHPLSPVTNYYGRDNVAQGNYLDLDEYIEALGEAHNVPEDMMKAYRTAFKAAVIYSAATPQLWADWTMHHAAGLSTRVFTKEYNSNQNGYNRLQWYHDVVAPRFTAN